MASQLPEGWVERKSNSHPGRVYYYNTHTGESIWEKPTSSSSSRSSDSHSRHHSHSSNLAKNKEEHQVQASHILVKHRDSRNPSSWKEERITRTKQEAMDKLKSIRARIVAGEDFAEVAQTESDCSSAKRGGDLGPFGRGTMQKPFEDAAFSLQVGELSDIVDTASGLHIILRTQ